MSEVALSYGIVLVEKGNAHNCSSILNINKYLNYDIA